MPQLVQLKKRPGTENDYDGVYKSIDPKGGQADKEVSLSIVDGNSISWNQESATWEKQ